MQEYDAILGNRGGFLSKKEIRTKLFNGSKREFLRSLSAFANSDYGQGQAFAQLYEPYKKKQLVPLKIMSLFFIHIEYRVQYERI